MVLAITATEQSQKCRGGTSEAPPMGDKVNPFSLPKFYSKEVMCQKLKVKKIFNKKLRPKNLLGLTNFVSTIDFGKK